MDPWTTDDGRLYVTPNGDNGHGDTARANGAGSGVLYRATRLDDVAAERVQWLWPRRLPLGKLVTLDGDPDVGKSTLCLDLVARLTTGRPMPGEARALVPASDVVLMAAEDGLDDTIRPRLDAAGADVARVHHFDAVPVRNDDGEVIGEAPPILPDHVAALEALIRATGAVLVVVDVLMAYLSVRADAHRDQDVRQALAPLAEMARRTGVCVLLLRHIPKSQRRSGQAVSAGSGSMGLIAVARAGMIAALDPADPSGQRRVLARAKGNLSPWWRSLTYRLLCADCGRPACDDDSHGCAGVDWIGESNVSGDELLSVPESGEERSKVDAAVDWLRGVLDAGPVMYRDLEPMARSEGYSRATLHRARQRAVDQSESSGWTVAVDVDQHARGCPSTWRLDFVSEVSSHDPMRRKSAASDQGDHARDGGLFSHSQRETKPVDDTSDPDRASAPGEGHR